MYELEQAFLQDPRTENKKAAKDINKEFIREWALDLRRKGYIKNLGISAYLDDLRKTIF